LLKASLWRGKALTISLVVAVPAAFALGIVVASQWR
jgi:hypothetical protein